MTLTEESMRTPENANVERLKQRAQGAKNHGHTVLTVPLVELEALIAESKARVLDASPVTVKTSLGNVIEISKGAGSLVELSLGNHPHQALSGDVEAETLIAGIRKAVAA